ncbi:MAG: alpha/beta fold hydrolase [Candidatus Poribacteria bacterium]|nr:alpha/beta fold hydrolase [Candidatus Poribacteria bacterium]
MNLRGLIRNFVIALILPVSLWAQTPETKPVGATELSHPSVSDETYQAILQFYQYDREMPLEARTVETVETPDYIREKVVFNGIRDSRVPGYLGLPTTDNGPFPCVLLIDGITGSKSRWWEDDSWPHGGETTKQLLAAGFAVLALDAQYHGERIAQNDYESPGAMFFQHRWFNRFREMTLQTTVEHRRAIDYLATRHEIDIERIGVLGHSLGGVIIFALNACEPRVKASVACVTPLNIWDPPELAVISPFNFARGIGKRPFLMLMGKSDNYYSPAQVEILLEMIEGNPKKLSYYESGHRLPEAYIAESLEWLKRGLE